MNKFLIVLLALGLSACTETQFVSQVAKGLPMPANTPQSQGTFKIGKPYYAEGQRYVPQETYSYEETGIASWYGPGFHNKSTASGETFNRYELTAAHRTLQMPSFVRVTNLDNGRSLVVRVNDRGPFSKARIIDLSDRAAELLGVKGPGTAKVKLQLLEKESREVAEAAKRGIDTRGSEVALNETGVLPTHITNGVVYPDQNVAQLPVTPTAIFVQFGAFANPANAQALQQQLASIGNTFVVEADVNGQHFYRVRVGPIETVDVADAKLAEIHAAGQPNAILIVDHP